MSDEGKRASRERATLKVQIENLRDKIGDLKSRDDEFITGLDALEKTVLEINHWYTGNGGGGELGAERRLQSVEDYVSGYEKLDIKGRLNLLEANMVALEKIADKWLDKLGQTVKEVMSENRKTAIAILTTWGPPVITGLFLLAIAMKH